MLLEKMEAVKAYILNKPDDIVEQWSREVRRDLGSSHEVTMTHEAIRSQCLLILEALARCLKDGTVESLLQTLLSDFWKHIHIPVEQGFNIEEMRREFDILRTLLASILELNYGPDDALTMTVLHQIDTVLELLMVRTVERYDQYQFERLESAHQELLSSNQELVRLVQLYRNDTSHLVYEMQPRLNTVVAFSSLLIRARLIRTRQQCVPTDAAAAVELEQLRGIYWDGKQMLQLVNRMLEAVRTGSQQLVTEIEQVQVAKRR